MTGGGAAPVIVPPHLMLAAVAHDAARDARTCRDDAVRRGSEARDLGLLDVARRWQTIADAYDTLSHALGEQRDGVLHDLDEVVP